jgi:hypothetical protein
MGKLTKIERKRRVRELVDRQQYGVPFNEADVAEMNAMCEWNFKHYKRIQNLVHLNDTRCVAHSDDGQNFEVWSWNRAISGGNIVDEALRAGVAIQMMNAAAELPRECTHCQRRDTLTVDHKDTPFSTIASDFLKLYPDHAPERWLINNKQGGGWRIGDLDFLNLWRDYHDKRATYQMLCRSCNASKGKRNAVQKPS